MTKIWWLITVTIFKWEEKMTILRTTVGNLLTSFWIVPFTSDIHTTIFYFLNINNSRLHKILILRWFCFFFLPDVLYIFFNAFWKLFEGEFHQLSVKCFENTQGSCAESFEVYPSLKWTSKNNSKTKILNTTNEKINWVHLISL